MNYVKILILGDDAFGIWQKDTSFLVWPRAHNRGTFWGIHYLSTLKDRPEAHRHFLQQLYPLVSITAQGEAAYPIVREVFRTAAEDMQKELKAQSGKTLYYAKHYFLVHDNKPAPDIATIGTDLEPAIKDALDLQLHTRRSLLEEQSIGRIERTQTTQPIFTDMSTLSVKDLNGQELATGDYCFISLLRRGKAVLAKAKVKSISTNMVRFNTFTFVPGSWAGKGSARKRISTTGGSLVCNAAVKFTGTDFFTEAEKNAIIKASGF